MKNRAILVLTLCFVFAGISTVLAEKRLPKLLSTFNFSSEVKKAKPASSKNMLLVPRYLQPKLRPYFMADNYEYFNRNLGKSVSVKGVVVRTKMGASLLSEHGKVWIVDFVHWPKEMEWKTVRVTGTVIKRHDGPELSKEQLALPLAEMGQGTAPSIRGGYSEGSKELHEARKRYLLKDISYTVIEDAAEKKTKPLATLNSRSGKRKRPLPLYLQLRSRGKTISRSDNWREGSSEILGVVSRKVWPNRIAHAKISLESEKYGEWIIEVEKNGSFSFQNIPEGTYTLKSFDTEGYKDHYYNPQNQTAKIPTFNLKKNEKLRWAMLKLEPERPYRTITGRVLDSNGNPLVGIDGLLVRAWTRRIQGRDKGQFAWISMAVVKDGAYELNSLDGRDVYLMAYHHKASAKDDPYPPTFYPSTTSRSKATLITFGKEDVKDNIDITMNKAKGKILEGTITDKKTSMPISQAMVLACHSDMLFDLFPVYTDEKGYYKFRAFGDGQYIMYVQARHKGYVKTSRAFEMYPNSSKEKLDFKLTRGISISGKLVDEQMNKIQPDDRAYGRAYVKINNLPHGNASNFPFGNKYAPEYMQSTTTIWPQQALGNCASAYMCFPTDDTFIIPAAMPGKTSISYSPREKGVRVKDILYQGESILKTGLQTEDGKDVKDITIVIQGQKVKHKVSESNIRGILSELAKRPEQISPKILADIKEQLISTMPGSVDAILSVMKNPDDKLHRKAVLTLVQLWENLTHEQMDKFFKLNIAVNISSRKRYPLGVETGIGAHYSNYYSYQGWPKDKGLKMHTVSRKYLDGHINGRTIEHEGRYCGLGWIPIQYVDVGKHNMRVVTEYTIEHKGRTFSGKVESKLVEFEIVKDMPNKLAAPYSKELEEKVKKCLTFKETRHSDKRIMFSGGDFRRWYDDPWKPQMSSGRREGYDQYAVHMPLYSLSEPLDVDLCFDVDVVIEKTGEKFSCEQITILKGEKCEGRWISMHQDLKGFVKDRDGFAGVKVVLTPSYKTALGDMRIKKYYNGSITSQTLRARVYNFTLASAEPWEKELYKMFGALENKDKIDRQLFYKLNEMASLNPYHRRFASSFPVGRKMEKDITLAIPFLVKLLNGGEGKKGYEGVGRIKRNTADHAREVLETVGKPAVPELIKGLKDNNDSGRALAVQALGTIGDKRAYKPLKELLKGDGVRSRWAAARVIGKFKDPDSVELLIDLLKDDDGTVRSSAATSLVAIGDKRAAKAFIACLNDTNYRVRQAAVEGLGAMQPKESVDLIIERLKNDESIIVRRIAVETLAKIEDSRVIDGLIEAALSQKNYQVRQAAVYELGAKGGKQVYTPLIKLLTDSNRHVRSAAVRAIGRVENPVFIEPLLKVTDDEYFGVRRSAIIILGRIGADRAVGPAIKMLKDKDSGNRQYAAQALGKLKDAKALDPLKALLNDEYSNVRQAAQKAIEQIEKENPAAPGSNNKNVKIKMDFIIAEPFAGSNVDMETFLMVQNLLGPQYFSDKRGPGSAASIFNRYAHQVSEDKYKKVVDLLEAQGFLRIISRPSFILDSKQSKTITVSGDKKRAIPDFSMTIEPEIAIDPDMKTRKTIILRAKVISKHSKDFGKSIKEGNRRTRITSASIIDLNGTYSPSPPYNIKSERQGHMSIMIMVKVDFITEAEAAVLQAKAKKVVGGYVVDHDKKPIAGAEVQIREKRKPGQRSIASPEVFTDANGHYNFSEIKWPYSVGVVWRQDLPNGKGIRHQYKRRNKYFEGNQSVNFKFDRFPSGNSNLSGKITDGSGVGVKEFVVDIKNKVDWKDYSTEHLRQYGYMMSFSATDGKFFVGGLPAGEYKVYVHSTEPVDSSYQWPRAEITLEEGKTKEIALESNGQPELISRQTLTQAYLLTVPADMDELKWLVSDGKSKTTMITPEKLEKFLAAVKNNKQAQLLSKPVILVNEGQEGKIISNDLKLKITNHIRPDKKSIRIELDFEHSVGENEKTTTKIVTSAVVLSDHAIALTASLADGKILLLIVKTRILESLPAKSSLADKAKRPETSNSRSEKPASMALASGCTVLETTKRSAVHLFVS